MNGTLEVFLSTVNCEHCEHTVKVAIGNFLYNIAILAFHELIPRASNNFSSFT